MLPWACFTVLQCTSQFLLHRLAELPQWMSNLFRLERHFTRPLLLSCRVLLNRCTGNFQTVPAAAVLVQINPPYPSLCIGGSFALRLPSASHAQLYVKYYAACCQRCDKLMDKPVTFGDIGGTALVTQTVFHSLRVCLTLHDAMQPT